VFSVPRTARQLRRRRPLGPISASAPVYLAAVLEYVSRELLHAAGANAVAAGAKRITPKHLRLAVHNNTELNQLVSLLTGKRGLLMPLLPRRQRPPP